jgi:hypothetical protein
MNLLPTWPIAVGGLVIGLAGGAYIDHSIMESRFNKLVAAHAEELRLREVQRAKDEVAAREEERRLTVRAGQIEQEKTDEINRVRTSADALIARLRNQATSKPASPSGVPQAATACESTAGAVVPERTGEQLVRLAERADEQRAGLAACYQAYDSLAR